ncbi:hypothetical protein AB0C76_38100 [Kitasatospora sp. NPDC048722]
MESTSSERWTWGGWCTRFHRPGGAVTEEFATWLVANPMRGLRP